MFCRNCGQQIKEGAAFCAECGWKVETAQAQPAQAQPAPKKGIPIAAIIAAAVICVIVLGVIAFFIIRAFRAKSDETEVPEEAVTENVEVAEPVNPDATSKLLTLIDETEKTTTSMNESMDDLDGLPPLIELTGKWKDELSGQYSRVKEIEGLPANMRKAAQDAYEMNLAAVDCMHEDLVFVQDIVELSETLNAEDLVQTYYDFQEKHDNAECPANMADSWKAMGDSLDLLATSVNRYNEGEQLTDNLRIYSANNHLIRFATVFNNEADKIAAINTAEMDFVTKQLETVEAIFEEIKTAATQTDAGEYTFRYNADGVIAETSYDHIQNIYPSLYNTYDSFVTLKIGCLLGERDIIVECEIPGLSQNMSQSYHIGAGLTALNIKPPAATEKLNLDTAKDTQIKLTVKDKKDGSLIDTQSFPVHLYGRNDFAWDSDEFGTITRDNILCFLAPDSDAITKLKRNAIEELSELSFNNMDSLVGYQGPYFAGDYDGDGYIDNAEDAEAATTYVQVASLMRAMSDMGVRYTNDVFSIDNAGQHILFPDQVLEKRTGLCIETSLVMASALQSMGMHTMLVFPPGHAQVAVETWEGSGYYYLIETTTVPNAPDDFLDESRFWISGGEGEMDNEPISFLSDDGWASYLAQDADDPDDDCYVLDCGDGALLGMTPFAY